MCLYTAAFSYTSIFFYISGRWCNALRRVIKEGYQHAGMDVDSPDFNIEEEEEQEEKKRK